MSHYVDGLFASENAKVLLLLEYRKSVHTLGLSDERYHGTETCLRAFLFEEFISILEVIDSKDILFVVLKQ